MSIDNGGSFADRDPGTQATGKPFALYLRCAPIERCARRTPGCPKVKRRAKAYSGGFTREALRPRSHKDIGRAMRLDDEQPTEPSRETATLLNTSGAAPDAEKIAALMREYVDEKPARPQTERRKINSVTVAVVCMAAAGILSIWSPRFCFAWFLGAWFLDVVVCTVTHPHWWDPHWWHPTPRQIEIAHELARSDSVQAIGPLVGILFPNHEKNERAPGALLRGMSEDQRRRVLADLVALLRRVSESDKDLVDRVYRLYECVYCTYTVYEWRLTGAARDDLVIGMLHAIGEVGIGARASDSVLSISYQKSDMTGIRVSAAVHEAIEHCLWRLHEREEAAREGQSLLRAAESPTANGTDLLQPVASVIMAESEDYLRPSSP